MSTTADILQERKATLGFWIYLMTDCLIFGSLFTTYIVLRHGTASGPTSKEIFDLGFVFIETVILLTSSFLCGLAIVALRQKQQKVALALLVATGLLGFAFLFMELTEFWHLVVDDASWRTSGFLTAFFVLVGTHGLHIFIGLIWLTVLIYLLSKRGITPHTVRKALLFSLFWHFLDVIWIFIFTIVYLMGVI